MMVAQVVDALRAYPLARKVNAAIKGPLQEWQAATSRWSYSVRARAKGSAIPSGNLPDALRHRLGPRWMARPPRKMGEMHVFVAYGLTDWEDILPRAFSTFGRVTSFPWRAEGFDDRAANWLSRRDKMNAAMLRAFDEANQSAPVDAFVGYLSGFNTAPETLLAVAKRGAVVFNFCWDDKLGFPGPWLAGRYTSAAALAHAVDLNLTNAPASLAKYQVHGGLAAFLPEAAYPGVHRPADVPFDIEVSFIGRNYGWRPQFIEKLGSLGVGVECFGPGWPNGALDEREMIKLVFLAVASTLASRVLDTHGA